MDSMLSSFFAFHKIQAGFAVFLVNSPFLCLFLTNSMFFI